VETSRANTVIIVIMALDVPTHPPTRSLLEIATRLANVLVGVQPDVALTMVQQLGLHLDGAQRRWMEAGLAYLDRVDRRR